MFPDHNKLFLKRSSPDSDIHLCVLLSRDLYGPFIDCGTYALYANCHLDTTSYVTTAVSTAVSTAPGKQKETQKRLS